MYRPLRCVFVGLRQVATVGVGHERLKHVGRRPDGADGALLGAAATVSPTGPRAAGGIDAMWRSDLVRTKIL